MLDKQRRHKITSRWWQQSSNEHITHGNGCLHWHTRPRPKCPKKVIKCIYYQQSLRAAVLSEQVCHQQPLELQWLSSASNRWRGRLFQRQCSATVNDQLPRLMWLLQTSDVATLDNRFSLPCIRCSICDITCNLSHTDTTCSSN